MNWREMVEYVFDIKVVRCVVASFILLRGVFPFVLGKNYRASVDFCWLYRVSNIRAFEVISLNIIKRLINSGLVRHENTILISFLKSKNSLKVKARYSLSGKGELDLFRDVIILKERKLEEKGVLLIKYTPTFDAFAAFFDIERVMQDFHIVLETSWSGACDPAILMYISPSEHVVIQLPEQDDFNFIAELNTNLLPISLGSGDWVDIETFTTDNKTPKKYDIIMVANWGRYKKHLELFRALSIIRSRQLKVMLIGFPWGGRTKNDIIEEMKGFELENVTIEIRENLQPHEVGRCLNSSKVFILLSKKEGGNKAMIEGFFSNIPAILYENNKGGNREKINSMTGLLSSYEDLGKSIVYMLDNFERFAPREWALMNTGSMNATFRLNLFLKGLAEKRGEKWTTDIVEKVNIPNLSYKKIEDSARFNKEALTTYLRADIESE